MDIIEKAKSLNLPLGEYIIVGAGVLQALGIRDTKDIDIVVTPSLFEALKRSEIGEEEIRYGKRFLIGEDIDVINRLDWEKYSTTTEQAIKSAMVIDGVAFLNIEETIKFKTALGRDVDFKDIELLKEYKRKNGN